MYLGQSPATYRLPWALPGAPHKPPHCGTPIMAFAAAYPIIFSVLVSIGSTIISAGVSMAFAAFTKKPKASPFTGIDRTVTVRQPIQPWQIVLGAARVGGDIFFFEKDGVDVWIGAVWAAHECKAIDSIYTDDTQNFVHSDGSVSGTNSGKMFVYNHLGDPDQTADSTVMAAFPLKWTAEHRGRGRCYSFVRFVNLATNWKNVIPNVTADLRGALIVDSRTGNEVFTDNAAMVSRRFVLDPDWGEGAAVGRVDNANFNAEANICDEELDLPNWTESFVFDSSDTFTANSTTDMLTFGAGLDDEFGLNGTPVYVFAGVGGVLPVPLVAGTIYYAGSINGATSNISLHPTAADAIAGTNIINLTTNGSGSMKIIPADVKFRMLGRETTFTAVPATNVVNFVDKLYPIGVSNAVPIFVAESTTTLPGGMVVGKKYWGPDGNLIFEYPNASANLDITSVGAGIHTARFLGHAALLNETNIDTAADTISITAGSVGAQYPGRPIIVRARAGSSLASPFVDGTTYFLSAASTPTLVRLADTRSKAQAGLYLDITSNPVCNYYLEVGDFDPDEVLGATTGMVVQVAIANGAGSNPSGIAAATDYYFVRRGRGLFSLASTLRDSLDQVLLAVTDMGSDTDFTYHVTLKRERRYTTNIVFDTDQDPRDTLKAICTSHAGQLLEPLGSGKWRIKVGAFRVPIGTLGLNDVRQGGSVDIQTRIARQQAANTVKAIYTSPLNFDHPTDIPAYSDPKSVAEDGGEQLVLDTQYPGTNSKTMAKRLARIDQRRKRLQRSVSFPARMPSARRFEFGDGIRIDLSPLSIALNVRVTGWTYKVANENGGVPMPTIDLALQEDSPWVYRTGA